MNSKANELGLTSTNFITPHGLDNDNHFTTAYDLAILTDYALTNKIFSKIVKTKTYTIEKDQVEYWVQFRPGVNPEIMFDTSKDRKHRLGYYIDIFAVLWYN